MHGMEVAFQILKNMGFRRPLYYFTVPGILLIAAGLLIEIAFLHLVGSFGFGVISLIFLMILTGIFMVFTGVILHLVSKMISQIVPGQKGTESLNDGF
ncbi:hypothetical protein DU43_01175 [Methanosarcina mazei]|uniref:Uncharacterized protein n=1 Tax=Methanosarcina mazei TaxID=2209 RepID=A0A0F8K297_METMZ|nr:hypothetical protein DU43_01175 [Methanosarcina mazei]